MAYWVHEKQGELSGKLCFDELNNDEKEQHTMTQCSRCSENYFEYQHDFPFKPTFQPKPVVQINEKVMNTQSLKDFTEML